jgi:hypothetical protein
MKLCRVSVAPYAEPVAARPRDITTAQSREMEKTLLSERVTRHLGNFLAKELEDP